MKTMEPRLTKTGRMGSEGSRSHAGTAARNEEREEYLRENRWFSDVGPACDAYFDRKGMGRLSLHQLRGMTYAQRQAYRLANGETERDREERHEDV